MSGGRDSVSVIVPVFNGARFLAEAIDSILGQTRRADEVIVVDDGSTDDTALVAKRYGAVVRYHLQPHGGAAVARNRGVQLAGGTLLSFLDADDLWVPGKLERQLAEFAADPELEAVFGHIEQFQVTPGGAGSERRFRFVGEAMPGYVPDTMLIRTDAFRRIGPLRAGLEIGEMIDWFARAVDLGLRKQLIPDLLARRRIHEANLGLRGGDDTRRSYARLMMEILRRRRGRAEPNP